MEEEEEMELIDSSLDDAKSALEAAATVDAAVDAERVSSLLPLRRC